MRVFHCSHCQQLVFFENTHCLYCGHTLAYLPDIAVMGSLDALADGLWQSPLPRETPEAQRYKLCTNYTQQQVCNWAIPAGDAHEFCLACRLNEVIPDLGVDGNLVAWARLETAKHRLVYGLLELGLPLQPKSESPETGLAFRFLADVPASDGEPVLTGHANGVITIRLAEADDVWRERQRVQMHEPYRTLLGHFRHEVGHYYWERLITGTEQLAAFRECFGDERADYAESLKNHYEQGAPADWQDRFISAYASAHPWEDWAECWAHYLHMVDALETAAVAGLSLVPPRHDEPSLSRAHRVPLHSFDAMLAAWLPLTYVLNNLNRGLGLPDSYPFVLSPPVVAKLRFIHEVTNH